MSTKEPIDLSQFEGHTPGPWVCSAPYGSLDDYYVMVGGHTVVSKLPSFTNDSSYAVGNDRERAVNSRLIAAAPTLLAELRERRARDAAMAERLHEIALKAEIAAGSGMLMRGALWNIRDMANGAIDALRGDTK